MRNGSCGAGSASPAAVSAPGAVRLSIAITIAARTNDTASMANATPVLEIAITAPAIGGPTIEAIW